MSYTVQMMNKVTYISLFPAIQRYRTLTQEFQLTGSRLVPVTHLRSDPDSGNIMAVNVSTKQKLPHSHTHKTSYNVKFMRKVWSCQECRSQAEGAATSIEEEEEEERTVGKRTYLQLQKKRVV